MHKAAFLTCIALGVLAMGPVLFALSTQPRPGTPIIVLAPPWEGGAAAVVQEAGLQEIVPEGAPWATLAAFWQPEDLEKLVAAGAWYVMDGEAIAAFCGV